MTNPEWAARIWPVLVEVAADTTTISYTDLANRIGFGHYRLSRQLAPIYWHCQSKKLPPLTILVVEKRTGRPSLGAGFEELDRKAINRTIRKVQVKNWRAVRVPTLDELQAAIAAV